MFVCGSSVFRGECVIIECKAIFSLHKAFCSHKPKKLCIPPFLHFVCVNTVYGEEKMFLWCYLQAFYISIKQRNGASSAWIFLFIFYFNSWQRSFDWNVAISVKIGFLAGNSSMQDFFLLFYILYPMHLPATIQVCKRCSNRENERHFYYCTSIITESWWTEFSWSFLYFRKPEKCSC